MGGMRHLTDPAMFRRFDELLTKNRPGYAPWYFLLTKLDKDPADDPTDPRGKRKIAWKNNPKHHLTAEQAIKYMRDGINIGIAATGMDGLCIIDIDDIEATPDSVMKPTLSVRSRKRIGRHYFYWTSDPRCKVNIPTDSKGEMRADWEYVVAPGSYVICSAEEVARMPQEQREFQGRYTIENPVSVADIGWEDVPPVFQEQAKKEAAAKRERRERKKKKKEKPPTATTKKNKSAIHEIEWKDIQNIPDKNRFPSLFHGSDTGKNTSIEDGILSCWRHNVTHTPWSGICVLQGRGTCMEVGQGMKGSGVGPGCLDLRSPEVFYIVWSYAKKNRIIPKDDPIPSKALAWYAVDQKICKPDDVVDGWKLPADAYNQAIALIESKEKISSGRERITGGVVATTIIDLKKTTAKLNEMPISDNAVENVRNARQFVESELTGADPAERRAFIESDVKKHFGFKTDIIKQLLKPVKTKHTALGLESGKVVYQIIDGCFVKSMTKKVEGNMMPYDLKLCNFTIDLLNDTLSTDEIDTVRWYSGDIHVNSNKIPFKAEANRFVTQQEFARTLADAGGSSLQFENRNLQDIRLAMQALSTPICRNIRQTFGMDAESKKYETPSVTIEAGSVKECSDSDIDLTDIDNAENLDMQIISEEDFQMVGKHIIDDLLNVHSRYSIDCIAGHTFMAPLTTAISRVRGWNSEHIGLWLVGITGSGKTFAASLFQQFFGDFSTEGAIASWTDTPYRIQYTGYFFKDALYMVDDFKIMYFKTPAKLSAMTEVLQNYTDGRYRGRLTSTIKTRKGRPIRGNLLITGEDLPSNEASILGRYHIVQMYKEDRDDDAGERCLCNQHLYSGAMARFISWVMQQDNYAEQIVKRIIELRHEFIADRDSTNISRIAQSFAYNLTGYELFVHFMSNSGFVDADTARIMIDTHKHNLEADIDSVAVLAQSATASEIFISTLQDLINTGEVKIHDKTNVIMKPNPAAIDDRDEKWIEEETPIENLHNCGGFDKNEDDPYLYLFGEIVYKKVIELLNRSDAPFTHTKHSLVTEMVKNGYLVPGVNRTASQIWYQDKNRKVWKIRKESINYEETAQWTNAQIYDADSHEASKKPTSTTNTQHCTGVPVKDPIELAQQDRMKAIDQFFREHREPNGEPAEITYTRKDNLIEYAQKIAEQLHIERDVAFRSVMDYARDRGWL